MSHIQPLADSDRIKQPAVTDRGLAPAKAKELIDLAESLGVHFEPLTYARYHEVGFIWAHKIGDSDGGMSMRTFDVKGDCAADFINTLLARIAEVLP